MEFFNSAIEVLQTLVVALGAGLGVWGAVTCWKVMVTIIPAPMLMCGKVTQKNLIDNSPLFRKKAKNLIEISKIFWYNKDMNYLILPCEILMNK